MRPRREWIKITSIEKQDEEVGGGIFVTIHASQPFVSVNGEDIILTEHEDYYKGIIPTKQTIMVKAIVYDTEGEVSSFASIGGL